MAESRIELERRAVRRAVLAVSVLEDLDLAPGDGGVRVHADGETGLASWEELQATFTRGGLASSAELLDAQSYPVQAQCARARLSAHLRLTALLNDPVGREQILENLRLVALPADHAFHPGSRWVEDSVLGDTLDVGLGVVDALPDRDDAVPLPAPIIAQLAAMHAEPCWPRAVAHAARMGELVASRLSRDTDLPDHKHSATYRFQPAAGALPAAVLRPMGGVDVLSLLATTAVRRQLAGSDVSGMRAVAVPMRNRGWYDLTHTDPSFVGAAWAATDVVQRGVPTALLVTADEVSMGQQRTIDLRGARIEQGADRSGG